MSWIDRMLEERLAQAARDGELDVPGMAGKPLPDLHHRRPDGWWTRQLVARERSADRLEIVNEFCQQRQAEFWRAADLDGLTDLVA